MEDVEKGKNISSISGGSINQTSRSYLPFHSYYVHETRLLNQFLEMLKFLVSFFNFVLLEEMTPLSTANGNNILSKINILTSSKYRSRGSKLPLHPIFTLEK